MTMPPPSPPPPPHLQYSQDQLFLVFVFDKSCGLKTKLPANRSVWQGSSNSCRKESAPFRLGVIRLQGTVWLLSEQGGGGWANAPQKGSLCNNPSKCFLSTGIQVAGRFKLDVFIITPPDKVVNTPLRQPTNCQLPPSNHPAISLLPLAPSIYPSASGI